jgi:hypothetical protein
LKQSLAMTHALEEIADEIARFDQLSEARRDRLVEQLGTMTTHDSPRPIDWLALIESRIDDSAILRTSGDSSDQPTMERNTAEVDDSSAPISQPAGDDRLLNVLLDGLSNSVRNAPLSIEGLARLRALYGVSADVPLLRSRLLHALARDGHEPSLRLLSELLASDPPPSGLVAALSPLFRDPGPTAGVLFPRLLDALAHPQCATLVLDLANFLNRSELVVPHPAASRGPHLAALLGSLTEQLRLMEENPTAFAQDATELAEKVAQSSGLYVALCDALGLIGDPQLRPKLYVGLTLGHRRLRAEAAAALARLGDSQGIDTLVQLASEAAVRPRVVAYLEELGETSRLAPEHTTPEALAEGQLAQWLAQPGRFAAAPQEMTLIDATTQFWPGHDEPVECFLFEYTYRIAGTELSGIGIAGPVTFSFAADLDDYGVQDHYAVYAGWDAQHAEIRETPAERLSPSRRADYQARIETLLREPYERAQLALVGVFFGDEILVVATRRAEQSGFAILDAGRVSWYPSGSDARPMTPMTAYCMHKGRKLLKTFNVPRP